MKSAARSIVLAALAFVLAPPPPAAQLPPAIAAATEEAAREANRDAEAAAENIRPYDIPAWNGSGPPPIEMFLARPTLSLVQMSPDGKHVAGVRRENGVTYLIVVPIDGDSSSSKALGMPGMSITGLDWGSNDRLLYTARADKFSFEADERGIIMIGAPRMYSIGIDLKTPMMLFENDKRLSRENFGAGRITGRIPGDPRHILMPMRMQFKLNLLKVDIYDGSWEVVGNGVEETMNWFVDRGGKPVIRFDRGNRRGTQIDVMLRHEGANGRVSWRKGQTLRVDRETSNTPDFNPLSGGPVSSQYYVTARPPGGGAIGVYLYDIEKDAMVETLFSKENADVSRVVFNPVTGDYAGAFYWEDRLKFEFADPRLRDMMAALDEGFQRAWNLVPVDRSEDGKRWLIHASNATNMGGYYIYDVEKKSANEIGLLQPAMARVKPGGVFAVGYPARDGLKINAYLTMPPGWTQASPKPPLIVMPHGGPEVRDVYSYQPLVQFLASRGYAVFQPNFRGSAGYGKAFQDAGRRHWGDAMQDDVADGVNFVIAQGMADPSRACIFGASYGGYSALMMSVRYPDMFKCVASASGPSDLVRMLRWERSEEGSDSVAYKYWVSQIGHPNDDRAMVEAASPALQADKVKAPVLLLHGKRDNTVPPEQSEYMRDALKKAGKPVDLITFQTAAHAFTGRDAKRFFAELEKFFGKHLGMSPASLLPEPG